MQKMHAGELATAKTAALIIAVATALLATVVVFRSLGLPGIGGSRLAVMLIQNLMNFTLPLFTFLCWRELNRLHPQ